MIPFLAINSLTPRNSESKLTLNALVTGFGLFPPDGVLGVGASLLEQAAAKHETQTAAKPPDTVFKNCVLFIISVFINKQNG
jgi:hypothetical protein